jgi:ActD protein
MSERNLYGLVAEFKTAEQLFRAAEETYAKGYRRMDGFAPFPIEGLPEALGKRTRIPLLVLLGGIGGGAGAYYMQWYANAISYPINIGGRPIHSWPAFIPITFELTVLAAALIAFLSVFIFSGLPRPYHPMFNLPQFERASQDRFFLCIEAQDPSFDAITTRDFLQQLDPLLIAEVPK